MKKTIVTAALVAVISVAGFSVYNLSQNKTKDKVQPVATEQTTQAEQQIKFSNDGKSVAHDGVADKTALETLKSLTFVGTKATSFGEMVISINNREADSSSEYWAFYVNGKLASEGAGTYKAVSGDKIEWRLEKF